MKRLFYLAILLMALSSPAWAQYAPVWRLEEVDGSPQVINPTVVKVSNGTLSCTGRVCTITISGGGGGSPGGSDTQLQYNNAGSFGGITGATTNGTFVTLTSPVFVTPALGTRYSGLRFDNQHSRNLHHTRRDSGQCRRYANSPICPKCQRWQRVNGAG